MRNLFTYGVIWIVSTWCLKAQNPTFSTILEKGDIVFQHLNGGELGRAIDKVTAGFGGKDYNHCGLVICLNDTLKIVEAIGTNVHISTIESFENRSSTNNLLVGRLTPAYRQLIDAAQTEALQYLGIPYDDYFELNNGKLYCSELIYEAFKVANGGKPLFELQPMTFKDPATGEFFQPWKKYYEQLHSPIPEGKPGINPGLISRSSKITVIFPHIQK